MTKEEILENNKLIAKFMGCYFVNDDPEVFPGGYYMNDDFPYPLVIEDYCFNSLWDWLMPVVEKIESIKTKETEDATFDVVILSNICQIGGVMNDIVEFDTDSKLKSTYLAVVEFIKRHHEYRNR